MAAGTVTITETVVGSIKRIKFAWASGTGAEGGTASGTTTLAYSGLALQMVTDPGATAPTDNYDVTVTDSDGIDVLNGWGANRDTANSEQVVGGMGTTALSKLTINVTNAGDAKEGVLYLDMD